jgi:hypothetical protein
VKESAVWVKMGVASFSFWSGWTAFFPKAVCGMRTKAVSGELGEGRKGSQAMWSRCTGLLLPAAANCSPQSHCSFVSTLSER